VRIVPETIHAHGRIGRRQIFFVYPDRRLVIGQRVKIAPDPVVDVARHMHEVAGAGNGTPQPVGIGLGALRPVRRLHRVDVIVDRARMVRVARQHAFERRHDRGALLVWRVAAGLPVIPRAEVHHRFSVEHRDLVVVRELRRDLLHG
jgi:hypothetical protein